MKEAERVIDELMAVTGCSPIDPGTKKHLVKAVMENRLDYDPKQAVFIYRPRVPFNTPKGEKIERFEIGTMHPGRLKILAAQHLPPNPLDQLRHVLAAFTHYKPRDLQSMPPSDLSAAVQVLAFYS